MQMLALVLVLMLLAKYKNELNPIAAHVVVVSLFFLVHDHGVLVLTRPCYMLYDYDDYIYQHTSRLRRRETPYHASS